MRAAGALFLLFLATTPAPAQTLTRRAFPAATLPVLAPASGMEGAALPSAPRGADGAPWRGDGTGGWITTPAGAFGASLLVPGLGQAGLGLRRWAVYSVLELGLWGLRLDAQADERRFRRGYRDLAWEAARLQDDSERRDGGWGYYEAMSHYLASGAFDRDPGTPGIQPETDTGTYNGEIWALAVGMFLPSGSGGPGTPGYERALAYYTDRAAGPAFLWDWTGRDAELERFRELIDRSDEEARRATGVLGLVLANHLVSAIDALIVARLRTQDDLHLTSGFYGHGPALRWRLSLELTTPY